MKLLLQRTLSSEMQTLGVLYLLNYKNHIIDSWNTLELPDRNNQRYLSRIPKGTYKARKHKSPKHGSSLWLQDVPNRSEILIHKGNFHYQIQGCILIGSTLKYIDNDSYLDVANSKASMIKLLEYLKEVDAVMITIKDG